MNEERERISPPTNIGISMLLVVFLVLCLFTFSSIALVQAENEYDNAVRSARIRSQYYDAVTASENELHTLNSSLDAGNPPGLENISKTYTINENMELSVTYTLETNEAGSLYRITDYRTRQTNEWSGDDKLNLVQ